MTACEPRSGDSETVTTPKLRLRDRKKKPAGIAPRQASSLDDDIPPAVLDRRLDEAAKLVRAKGVPGRGTYRQRVAEIRRVAGQEYITDSEARSVRWWYDREDRTYKASVTWSTFEGWSTEDAWAERRQHFWTRVEQRVLEHVQHELLQQRLREIGRLTPASDAMLEYLEPRRGSDGQIQRHPALLDGEPHPFAGLPVIPLLDPRRPSAIEKVVKSWIELHKTLMTKRGEVTQRTATVDQGQGSNPLAVVDPVSSGVPFSPDQISQLAQLALRMRQPELEGDVLDKIAEYERTQAEADADAAELDDDEKEDSHGGGETTG